ncbi:MAG: hypothetical protein KJO07_21975, partial [Deltaproteobacteria bacterium]|nr:hypothetical protein [Deltaproteobacteria bacterium]
MRAWFIGCLAALVACAPDFPDTREVIEAQSFGTEVVNLLCKRIAYLEDLGDGDGVTDVRGDRYRQTCRDGSDPGVDAPASLRALIAARPELIAAIDTTVPDGELRTLQAIVTNEGVLALYDDGTMARAVTGLGDMLLALGEDGEVSGALAGFNQRLGYAPRALGPGLIRASVDYPELAGLLRDLPALLGAGGPGAEGWLILEDGLAASIGNASAPEDRLAADRTATLALDLLLSERPGLGTGQPVWLVARDARGQAVVDTSGGLPGLFVDDDGDGLADIDPVGRFVGPDGEPVGIPPFAVADDPWPFRDGEGRALVSDGGPLAFEYRDLDQTLLSALIRDTRALFDEGGGAVEMMYGAGVLMGDRVEVSRSYDDGTEVVYTGFQAGTEALLDIAYGYIGILAAPNIDDVLEVGRQLVTAREQEAARLMEAMVAAARSTDAFPEALMDPDSPIWDDMAPIIRQILEVDGLAEDIIRSLEDPRAKILGPRLAEFMTYTDEFDYDENQSGFPVVGSLATTVDRSQNDTGANRSLMRRMLHAIADAYGTTVCNKQDAVIQIVGIDLRTFDECTLLQIDDVGVFFLQSMARAKNPFFPIGSFYLNRPKAEFPLDTGGGAIGLAIDLAIDGGAMESLSGIDGLGRHPSPQSLGRLLFLDPAPTFVSDLTDPIRTKFGDRFIDKHPNTLAAWDLGGFYDGMQAVVQPFADHDSEQLLLDLLVVLHSHWPSRQSEMQQSDPAAVDYAWASNLVSYEPAIAEVLANGDLLDALVDTAPALNGISTPGGDFPEVLADAARFLFALDPDLRGRSGGAASQTSDGRTIDTLSPWQVLADGYERKTRIALADPGGADAWDRGTRRMVDTLMRGEDDGGWQFSNPNFPVLSVALIDFVGARVADHRTAGDLEEWIYGELPADVDRLLGSPIFAGTADLAAAMAGPDGAAARAQLDGLMLFLLSPNTVVQATTLAAVSDLLQLQLDDDQVVPLARAVGPFLGREVGMVDGFLTLTARAGAADTTEFLPRMIRTLYLGDSATIDVILTGVEDVQRRDPVGAAGAPLEPADFAAVLTGVGGFFRDEARGFHKFVNIVE